MNHESMKIQYLGICDCKRNRITSFLHNYLAIQENVDKRFVNIIMQSAFV